MERRLAAVLIADVVGYGRFSQIGEEGTRTRFQADLREIFAPRITAQQSSAGEWRPIECQVRPTSGFFAQHRKETRE